MGLDNKHWKDYNKKVFENNSQVIKSAMLHVDFTLGAGLPASKIETDEQITITTNKQGKIANQLFKKNGEYLFYLDYEQDDIVKRVKTLGESIKQLIQEKKRRITINGIEIFPGENSKIAIGVPNKVAKVVMNEVMRGWFNKLESVIENTKKIAEVEESFTKTIAL